MLVGVRWQLGSWLSPSTVSSRIGQVVRLVRPTQPCHWSSARFLISILQCRLHHVVAVSPFYIWNCDLGRCTSPGTGWPFASPRRPSWCAAQAPLYSVFSSLQLLTQHWGSGVTNPVMLGIWAIKMMIDPGILPCYLVEVFKLQRLLYALINLFKILCVEFT